jgi:outer membrane protein TolC
MDVSNSYASLLEARQRIDSATGIKEAATQSYERAESRYRTGLGTSVDVLNALNDVSQAEADIVQARADYQIIKAELDYLAGRIPN